jgi:hypothetical protein
MALPARQYLRGSSLAAMGAIGCNPGNWPTPPDAGNPSDPINSEFPDCIGKNALGSPAGSYAARLAPGLGMCFSINPQSYAGGSPDLSTLTDIWTPAGSDQNYSCGKTNQSPYANPWSSTNVSGLDVCTGVSGNNVATGTPPFDNAPVVQYIDDPSSLRYEFLFVVTPKTVNTGDMSNSASSVYAQYAPTRFRTDNDCGSSTPTPAGGKCLSQNMFRSYGLKLHDVADAGDPPASDPNRAGVFPVCALQPNPL